MRDVCLDPTCKEFLFTFAAPEYHMSPCKATKFPMMTITYNWFKKKFSYTE